MIMLSSKNLISDYKQVPATWVFEHYGELDEILDGQDLKIYSVFKEERTPSMSIYVDAKSDMYKFKDFSSGYQGSHVDFVMKLYKLTFVQAANKIVSDYNTEVLKGNLGIRASDTIKRKPKFRLSSYNTRYWQKHDAVYWLPFNIGSTILNKHHVRPISDYTMLKKNDDGTEESFVVRGNYLYGYFTEQGELYKLYQPTNKERKFIIVRPSHIQGYEQLEGHETLVITSSLKDLMSLKSMGLRVDSIAPGSENTMLLPKITQELLKKYPRICTLFDNDNAGIEGMKKYRETYQIEPILLTLSKDLSDSVRDYGVNIVRDILVPKINAIQLSLPNVVL